MSITTQTNNNNILEVNINGFILTFYKEECIAFQDTDGSLYVSSEHVGFFYKEDIYKVIPVGKWEVKLYVLMVGEYHNFIIAR